MADKMKLVLEKIKAICRNPKEHALLILSAVLGTGEYLGSGMGIIEGILHHGEPTKFYTFF